MSQNLKNKVVVVTGAAQGMGYHIAEEFLKHDLKALILLDINENKGKESTRELNSKYADKVTFIKCDVTKDLEEVFKKIIDKYESVDILVNNAGIVNEKDARRVLETNTIALIEWTMKFWEHMRKDNNGKGGTVINISSTYGYIVDPYLPVYKASKYGVFGFSKTLGHIDNYNNSGVRVMVICPGSTHTSMTDDTTRVISTVGEGFLEYLKTVKWQTADAVGKAAIQVFERGESGTAWKIEGGELEQVA